MQEVSGLAVEGRDSKGEELLAVCPSRACGLASLPELMNFLHFLLWYYVTWTNRLGGPGMRKMKTIGKLGCAGLS